MTLTNTKTSIAAFAGAVVASLHTFSFALVTSPLTVLSA